MPSCHSDGLEELLVMLFNRNLLLNHKVGSQFKNYTLKKIVTIIGARPQFIKAAMVSMEIARHDDINEVIIHTGQHFDKNMSNIFFEEMSIPEPDYNLGIQSLSHGAMTGRQLEEIEKVLLKEKPDWVLVHGDTNSTLAGALAAVKLHIPVGHVEAGLRSFNNKMPEEINRVLADHISKKLFVPTDSGVVNLKNEGIDENKIIKVGDVMYDAALYFGKIAEKESNIIDQLQIQPKQYILSTVHRQENTDNPQILKNIFSALADAPLPVIIPLHPRTKKKLAENDIPLSGQIVPIEPVGYLDMVMLEKNAQKIATDSGGIQKEAYFYEVPCITLRNETEWIELVEAGVNFLVGSNQKNISEALNGNLSVRFIQNLYGEGNARMKIISQLI
jgi:UDP-GlcNAc3NAcA epimerase